ncbi:hypothetical protein OBBRIDRAFT_837649 [Obba rivulosa]|uniref:Helitron helicase-like domain-containing protein n=1 Tax=Obba rivulosa TaxID=1052685 RepID=A0A8E2AS32_9APHY|nr:hypothetical protein OBBRIDRAFT_837649 [Obba rivulosa]
MDSPTNALATLSVKEILLRVKGILTISRHCRSHKEALIDYVVTHAPQETLSMLQELSQHRRQEKNTNVVSRATDRKRKRNDAQNSRRTARRLEDPEVEDDNMVPSPVSNSPLSDFLEVPSSTNITACYHAFREATSNESVQLFVCAVCGREAGVEDGVMRMSLDELPNSLRLVPQQPHPAHDLVDGKLLEPKGVEYAGPTTFVTVCQECLSALKKNSQQPPKYSLANGLWVGKVPWHLQVLTIPEQMLIALLYPRVYVFKLFPKQVGSGRDPSTLQRAMRGNVSTYELNIEGVASMVQGKLMPRPPAILASIISVTFIGIGQLPHKWLRTTFRVRRQFVHEALQWLKENNWKYYGDIEIDSQRICDLPEDDIPLEIMNVTRQSTDTGLVAQESEGYVPLEELEENVSEEHSDSDGDKDGGELAESSAGQGHDDNPDVIPLQISGSIDTDLSALSANELMIWGLANLWQQGQEGGYSVRHSRRPVNDFGRPKPSSEQSEIDSTEENFFKKVFPCLFPYGCGGIEATRPVPVEFREHIKWTLRYYDGHFRKHETYAFAAFGISQRRQALASARVQMKRKNFEADAQVLSTITLEKLQQAAKEEEANISTSDPAIQLLRQHIHAIAGRVQGSDQGRYQLRSQIWATSIAMNPPSLWITINPSDLHDPIAQIFAGEQIDLDAFSKTVGPDKEQRARNIAADPYAAAHFFHYMIRTLLTTIFGVEMTSFRVKSHQGVFGRVSAYFGTVESQARGSLHLHMLVWLRGAPTSQEMHELLQQDAFRERVKAFICANLRAYLPGLESKQDISKVLNESDIAYSRPPDPSSADYEQKLLDFERRLARSQ